MKIHIEEPNRAGKPYNFLGDKHRLATMTSVRLIDDETFVACHLAGERMMAYRIDRARGSAERVSDIETTFRGQPTITDLLDHDGAGLLVASNFDGRSCSLYRFDDHGLRHVRDLGLPGKSGRCHAARFHGRDRVCLGTRKHDLYFLSVDDGSILSRLRLPWHPKDFCFLEDGLMMVAFAVRSPNAEPKPTFSSGLMLLRLAPGLDDYEVIDTLFVRPAAFDAVVRDGDSGVFYVTDQHRDRVLLARTDGRSVEWLGEVTGFDFPHGIDVQGDLLAVTNYGDSTVALLDKTTLSIELVSGRTGHTEPGPGRGARPLLGALIPRMPGLRALRRVVRGT